MPIERNQPHGLKHWPQLTQVIKAGNTVYLYQADGMGPFVLKRRLNARSGLGDCGRYRRELSEISPRAF